MDPNAPNGSKAKQVDFNIFQSFPSSNSYKTTSGGCWRRAQRRGVSEVSTADILGLATAMTSTKTVDSLVRMVTAKWLHDAVAGTSIPLENLLKEMQSERSELALLTLAALPEDWISWSCVLNCIEHMYPLVTWNCIPFLNPAEAHQVRYLLPEGFVFGSAGYEIPCMVPKRHRK